MSHRERDDNYKGLVRRINDRYRIIVCAEGRQFILQYRRGEVNSWRGTKYIPTMARMEAILASLDMSPGLIDAPPEGKRDALATHIAKTPKKA